MPRQSYYCLAKLPKNLHALYEARKKFRHLHHLKIRVVQTSQQSERLNTPSNRPAECVVQTTKKQSRQIDILSRYPASRTDYTTRQTSQYQMNKIDKHTLCSLRGRSLGYEHSVIVTKKPPMCQIIPASLYCINGSIEDRRINQKNSYVCNSNFIAKSVLLEFF